MTLCFLGGGAFAATVLQRLQQHYAICCVFTPPPAPAGRKRRLTPPPAAQTAALLGLPLFHDLTPRALQAPDAAGAAQAVIVCDYGKILSRELLTAARTMTASAASAGANSGAGMRPVLNIHPSLLPQWRGAAPIERAILAGEQLSGVTIMEVAEKLDSGDMRAQQRMPIDDSTTAGDLTLRLANAGAALLRQVLDAPQAFPPQAQQEAKATYAAKLSTAERRLNFALPCRLCLRQMRAFSSLHEESGKARSAAYFLSGGERILAHDGECASLQAAGENFTQHAQHAPPPPGTLLAANAKGVFIACQDGALKITRLQRAGRRPLPAAEFLRGAAHFTVDSSSS